MIINLNTGERLYGMDYCPDPGEWYREQEREAKIQYHRTMRDKWLGVDEKGYSRHDNALRALNGCD